MVAMAKQARHCPQLLGGGEDPHILSLNLILKREVKSDSLIFFLHLLIVTYYVQSQSTLFFPTEITSFELLKVI